MIYKNNNKMKTFKIIHKADNTFNEETPKKIILGKLSIFIISIIILSYLTLLTSCMVFVPFHGRGWHGGHERHERRD
jgi:hypothetical protein